MGRAGPTLLWIAGFFFFRLDRLVHLWIGSVIGYHLFYFIYFFSQLCRLHRWCDQNEMKWLILVSVIFLHFTSPNLAFEQGCFSFIYMCTLYIFEWKCFLNIKWKKYSSWGIWSIQRIADIATGEGCFIFFPPPIHTRLSRRGVCVCPSCLRGMLQTAPKKKKGTVVVHLSAYY